MTENTVDYLDEDPLLSDQKYVCLSFLTNQSFKKDPNNPKNVMGVKVRGVY